MAKKGGLGTGVNTLLRGSASQRNKQARKAADREREAHDETIAFGETGGSSESSVVDLTAASAQASKPVAAQAVEPMPAAPMPAEPQEPAKPQEIEELKQQGQLRQLPVDQIRRGTYQPRQQFDETALQELADSITAQGLIQPILVRPFAGGYELVAGERRWRAAQLANLTEIPAIVREIDDQSVAAVALIENIQRKDLNPLEEAQALQRLQSEFSMTHEAVAEAVGRSRAAVTNLLRLLELPQEVKQLLLDGQLDMGHARSLLGAPASQQVELANLAVHRGLSVRATEKLVRELRNPDSGSKRNNSKSGKTIDPDIAVLQRDLADKLAAKVEIRHDPKGSGRLEISYNSLDELDGILGHIK